VNLFPDSLTPGFGSGGGSWGHPSMLAGSNKRGAKKRGRSSFLKGRLSMNKLYYPRLHSISIAVVICCFTGCDIPYEMDVIVASKTGEPLRDVSYTVLEGKYKNNVSRGTTNSDGHVHWGTVGKCDLLVELEKPGFKKFSKKVEMKRPGSPAVVLEMEEER
jgi:hypothetical protein